MPPIRNRSKFGDSKGKRTNLSGVLFGRVGRVGTETAAVAAAARASSRRVALPVGETSEPAQEVTTTSVADQEPDLKPGQDNAPENNGLRKDAETQKVECYFCGKSELMQKPTAARCGHVFCDACIMKWLKAKDFCPICRTPLTMFSMSPLH